MKVWSFALAAGLALAATSAGAHSEKKASHPPRPSWEEPLGPIGLDGAPPSPLCRASLGEARHIHCLHNIIWHGGMYYIDDLKDQR